MYDLCIKHGKIVTEDNSVESNLYIKDEKIVLISDEMLDSERTIDAKGMLVMPGFIDPHTHLNDPGLTESEDFYTGTVSAAFGGTTTVLEHPLTFPLPDNEKAFLEKRDIANSKAVVDFALFGALSSGNYEEVDKMVDCGAIAFKTFLPYSSEIPSLNDFELLEHMQHLSTKNVPLCIHCENDSIVRGATEKMIKCGKTDYINYNQGRPEIAEIESVNRVCNLCKASEAKVHVVHCSTSESVAIVNDYAKKGVDITVETCPHYLVLNTEDTRKLGSMGICNPPLRNQLDVERLRDDLKNEQLEFVGSDHATYTFEEKAPNDNVFDVPAGLTGIQTCYPLLYDEMKKMNCSDELFVKMSSTNAAKRFNIYPKKGTIHVGSDADLVIFDPEMKWLVTPDILKYKMKWSPYMGREIKGKVIKTIVRGTVVVEDNKVMVDRGFGEYVRPEVK